MARRNDPALSPLLALLSGTFAVMLVLSNIVAVKLVQVGPLVLPGAVIIFPITYIFSDILTEVYGYGRTRVIIWLGLGASLFATGIFKLVEVMPPAAEWPGQQAYSFILGSTPRIAAASILAYLSGEFLNSLILSRLKVVTEGRWLWLRTIGSTLVGQGADTVLFIGLAFAGNVSWEVLAVMIASQWTAKVLYEVIATPLTYLAVGLVKRSESIDVYDRRVNYNPFILRTGGDNNRA